MCLPILPVASELFIVSDVDALMMWDLLLTSGPLEDVHGGHDHLHAQILPSTFQNRSKDLHRATRVSANSGLHNCTRFHTLV
jgi:hypothetical protein